MSNFTEASARLLARQLLTIERKKRNEVVFSLDTDFRISVVREIKRLESDIPLELRDTEPASPIAPCL